MNREDELEQALALEKDDNIRLRSRVAQLEQRVSELEKASQTVFQDGFRAGFQAAGQAK